MKSLVLDSTGNIPVINNTFHFIEGADEIAQRLTTRIKTFFAEWFLDQGIGIPYFQHILVKNPNPTVVDTIFKNVIIETQGVTELQAFIIDLDEATRELTVNFTAETDEGIITLSVSVP